MIEAVRQLADYPNSAIFVLVKKDQKTLIQGIDWANGYTAYLLIALVAIGIYFPTLSFSFSPLDDEWLIVKRFDLFNEFSSIKVFFSEAMLDTYYRPVWVSSHLLDVMIGGEKPWIFHLMNTIYHSSAAILLYILLKKLNIEPQIALVLSLIFAIHPINVQSVASIPGRTDILLAIFSLSTMICFINYCEFKRTKSALLCISAFTLALFTKESAIAIPFALMAYYFLFFNKIKADKPIIFFLALFSITLIWFLLRHAIVPVYPALLSGNIFQTIQDVFLAFVLYIGKIILPINQAIMPTASETPLLPYAIAIVLLSLGAWKLGFKENKVALFGVIWFFLFISISIVAGSTKGNAEHIEQRAYVPLAGILMIISQIDFSKSRKLFSVPYTRLIAISVFLLFSFKTIQRSKVYANPLILSQTAVNESPHQAYFYTVLGKICLANNSPEEALKWYDKYMKVFPKKSMSYVNIGLTYYSLKQFEEAIINYNKAIELEPNTSSTYLNRSHAYFELKMYDNALRDLANAKNSGENIDEKFQRQIEHDSQLEKEMKMYTDNIISDTATSYSYIRRGLAYFSAKQYLLSINDFSTGLKLNPKDPICLINRGFVYETEGKLDSAYTDYKKLADMGYPVGKKALENLKKKMGLRNS